MRAGAIASRRQGRASLTSRRKPRSRRRRVRKQATWWIKLRRRALILGLAGLTLAAGYQFYLRDLPVVAVKHVRVSGLPAKNGAQIRRALVATAEDMTTLHVRRDELMQAVSGFAAVRAIEVDADFPNTLKVRVIPHRPVAVVGTVTGIVPVSANGTILKGLNERGLKVPRLALGDGAAVSRLSGEKAESMLRILAASPRSLLRRLAKVYVGSRGVALKMRTGPTLYFGTGEQADEKWSVVQRLLAENDAKAASYLDVRTPNHPAAGGLVNTSDDMGGAEAGAVPTQPPGTPPAQQPPAAGTDQPAPGTPAPPTAGPDQGGGGTGQTGGNSGQTAPQTVAPQVPAETPPEDGGANAP